VWALFPACKFSFEDPGNRSRLVPYLVCSLPALSLATPELGSLVELPVVGTKNPAPVKTRGSSLVVGEFKKPSR
jgi:hypothetical protein